MNTFTCRIITKANLEFNNLRNIFYGANSLHTYFIYSKV